MNASQCCGSRGRESNGRSIWNKVYRLQYTTLSRKPILKWDDVAAARGWGGPKRTV